MGCFFLLGRTVKHVHESYPQLFSGKGKAQYASFARTSGLNGFGWYLQIKSVAEKGVFTFGNNSPIKSVEKTNLYDFLTYIAANASEALYQEKIREHESSRISR